MMKKAVLCMAVVLVFAAGAAAQMPSSPVKLYAGGALSVPQSPDAFSDAYKTGFHGFVGVGYSALPMLQLIGKIEYNRFSYDADASGYSTLTGGGAQNVWLFGADGRYSFNIPSSPVKPFAFAGGGIASIKFSDFEGTDLVLTTALNSALESQSKFYWNLGAGADFAVSPMVSLFVQGRYVSIQTDGDAQTWVPVSLGLRFF